MDWKPAPWAPRNIIRFESLPPLPCIAAEPRGSARLSGFGRAAKNEPAPVVDGARWRRVLDAILTAIKPFDDAWQAMRRAAEPLLREVELA